MPRHSASNAGDSQPRLSSPPGLQSPQTPAATPRDRSTPRTAESQASLPNANDSDVMARGGLAKQFSQTYESAGHTLQLAGLMLAVAPSNCAGSFDKRGDC